MLVGTIFYSVLTLYPNKLECLSLAGLFTRGLIFVRLKFTQGILKGKYPCTVDLLFDWFGLVCFATENKNC